MNADLANRANYWLEHTDGSASIEQSITFDLIREQADRIEVLEAALRRCGDSNYQTIEQIIAATLGRQR